MNTKKNCELALLTVMLLLCSNIYAMDSLQRSVEIPSNKKKVTSHQEKLSESDVLFEEYVFDDDSQEVCYLIL